MQYVMCHMIRRDSHAIKSARVEILFTFTLFHWLKPLAEEEGEETGVPGENPRQRVLENAILNPEN